MNICPTKQRPSPAHLRYVSCVAALMVGLMLSPAGASAAHEQPRTVPTGIYDTAHVCINYRTSLPKVTGSQFVVYSPASLSGLARTVAGIINSKDVFGVYERGLAIPSLLQPGQPAPFPIFLDPAINTSKFLGATARLCQHLTWSAVVIAGTLSGDALAGTVYHELFHAGQFALIKTAPIFDNWWFEATASAAEAWFGAHYPERYSPYVTAHPEVPMDHFGNTHEYGAYLFIQWVLHSASMPDTARWAFLRASIEDLASHRPDWDAAINEALHRAPRLYACHSDEPLLACDLAAFWADETNQSSPAPILGHPPAKLLKESVAVPGKTFFLSAAELYASKLVALSPAMDKKQIEVIIPTVPAGVDLWVNLGDGQFSRLWAGEKFDETFCRSGLREGAKLLPATGDVRLALTTTQKGHVPQVEVEVRTNTNACPQTGGITMFQQSVNGGTTPAAVFLSATCREQTVNHVAQFHATAKSGSYKLQVSIKPFTGYHTYALHWQTADPGFVVDGPGGPFSNVYWPGGTPPNEGGAITFEASGAIMGLGFLEAWNRTISDSIVLAGTVPCHLGAT